MEPAPPELGQTEASEPPKSPRETEASDSRDGGCSPEAGEQSSSSASESEHSSEHSSDSEEEEPKADYKKAFVKST